MYRSAIFSTLSTQEYFIFVIDAYFLTRFAFNITVINDCSSILNSFDFSLGISSYKTAMPGAGEGMEVILRAEVGFARRSQDNFKCKSMLRFLGHDFSPKDTIS